MFWDLVGFRKQLYKSDREEETKERGKYKRADRLIQRWMR